MKKFIYTLFFFVLFSFSSFSQNEGGPGFGDEGGGDAQTNPEIVPISDNIEWVLLAGLLLGAYFVYNNKKSLAKN